MPTPQELLAGLSRIANETYFLAVLWHLIAAAAVVALLAGWRPTRRLAASLLALPALSAAELAWAYGNPFNGALLALLAVALVAFAPSGSERVEAGPLWATALGTAMLAFAWVYPHFLADRDPTAYLIGAPLGVIPCPTLAALVGAALFANGFAARGWCLVLAAVAGCYGVFGLARLGVTLDAMLLVGAAALAGLTLAHPATGRPGARPVMP